MEKNKKGRDVAAIVARTVERLRETVVLQQAILFGSCARGEATNWSDVDLAVISPDFGRMGQSRIMDLMVDVALSVDPSLDIRPYTPADLREARPTNFLGHILAEGKVVYKDGRMLV